MQKGYNPPSSTTILCMPLLLKETLVAINVRLSKLIGSYSTACSANLGLIKVYILITLKCAKCKRRAASCFRSIADHVALGIPSKKVSFRVLGIRTEQSFSWGLRRPSKFESGNFALKPFLPAFVAGRSIGRSSSHEKRVRVTFTQLLSSYTRL
jgi:hypothetical protein